MTTAEMSLSAFSDALASKQSTPGGGSAAAVVGSQAAALVSMVIRVTMGKKKYAAVEAEMQDYLEQSEALRHELLALADKDAEAFNAVAACFGMPRTTPEEKAARSQAMQAALKGATLVPFTVAERCLAVLKLAEPVVAKGNVNAASDGATAMYLANAALLSAIANVNINLQAIKDAAFVEEWSNKKEALLAERAGAYAAAKAAGEGALGQPL